MKGIKTVGNHCSKVLIDTQTMVIKLTNEKLHIRVWTQVHRQKKGIYIEIDWS